MSDTIISASQTQLCTTPEQIIELGEGRGRETTKKVLSKVLEQSEIQYLETVVDKARNGEELNLADKGFLMGILSDTEKIELLNNATNLALRAIAISNKIKDSELKTFALNNKDGKVDVTFILKYIMLGKEKDKHNYDQIKNSKMDFSALVQAGAMSSTSSFSLTKLIGSGTIVYFILSLLAKGC